MSTASRLTLLGTIVGTVGVVGFVHWAQTAEKAVIFLPTELETKRLISDMQAMHAGVVRDMEQQRVKRERKADFEMQRQLEEEYKKIQSVPDSTETSAG